MERAYVAGEAFTMPSFQIWCVITCVPFRSFFFKIVHLKLRLFGTKVVISMVLIFLPCIIRYFEHVQVIFACFFFAVCFVHGTICLKLFKHWCCRGVFHHQVVLVSEGVCLLLHLKAITCSIGAVMKSTLLSEISNKGTGRNSNIRHFIPKC